MERERRLQAVDNSPKSAKDIRAVFAAPKPREEPRIRRRQQSQEELESEAREAERMRREAEQVEQVRANQSLFRVYIHAMRPSNPVVPRTGVSAVRA